MPHEECSELEQRQRNHLANFGVQEFAIEGYKVQIGPSREIKGYRVSIGIIELVLAIETPDYCSKKFSCMLQFIP